MPVFHPVLQAGNHFGMNRMGHKEDGYQEREKDVVVKKQPLEDEEKEHCQCPVQQDVDGVASPWFLTPQLVFDGKGGLYDRPVIGRGGTDISLLGKIACGKYLWNGFKPLLNNGIVSYEVVVDGIFVKNCIAIEDECKQQKGEYEIEVGLAG